MQWQQIDRKRLYHSINNDTAIYFKSYDTIVARYHVLNCTLEVTSAKYSKTTSGHITHVKSWLQSNGFYVMSVEQVTPGYLSHIAEAC